MLKHGDTIQLHGIENLLRLIVSLGIRVSQRLLPLERAGEGKRPGRPSIENQSQSGSEQTAHVCLA